MKQLSLILNFLLLVAVAILYYLHFSGSSEAAHALPQPSLKGANIVFVNSDSLIDNYNYYKTKKAEFEEKQARVKGDLKAEGTKLQGDIMDYQKKAESLTDAQRQSIEKQLSARQQEFVQKKDDLLAKLDDEQSKSNEELYTKLTSYMKEFNKKKNYNFILGYQKGGGILFANDSLDITKEVTEGLNKDYEKEKK